MHLTFIVSRRDSKRWLNFVQRGNQFCRGKVRHWQGKAAQAYYEQLVHEGKIKPTVSDNVIRGRVEVADAPPEGARPQVHNAGCAMKPPGQSVGTDSKTGSLAQKNVLTLAPALRAGETVGDNPSRQMTGPGSCQAAEPNPSPDKGSRQLLKSCTSTK